MTSVPFSQALAEQLYQSTEKFPVDFDDAWQWLGYYQKSDGLTALKKCGFIEGVDFSVEILKTPTGGRPSTSYYLNCECLKQWGMMAGTNKGKEIRMYFLECERIAKEATKSMTPAEIAVYHANLFLAQERRMKAIEDQQVAIREKQEALEYVFLQEDLM